MWPDNETTLDLMNVQHFVSAIAEIVRRESLLPATVGIYGGWGQGKSSLIRMVEKELASDESVLTVSFNGWLFESYDDAKSALMASILDEIRERGTLDAKAKELLGRLTSRIDWFRAMSLAGRGALTFATAGVSEAGALMGLLNSGIPAKAGDGAEGDQNIQTIRGFRDDFVALLDQTNIETLVVFIDELDRCLPKAVVETLEAIRLFLFVERTAFVIGADEELVRQSVGLRFADHGLGQGVGGRYLEKMVQIPFRIPPMSRREIRTYMNLLFTSLEVDEERFVELLNDLPKTGRDELGEINFGPREAGSLLQEYPDELRERFILTDQLVDDLARGLQGNPRQVKRFLNMLLLRLRLAEYRGLNLERRVLGKLMLLEYFHPERFRELAGRYTGKIDGREDFASLEAAAASEKGNADPTDEEAAPEEDETELPTEQLSLPSELRDWVEDPELRSWMVSEPRLGEVNLRPYFYIARQQSASSGGIAPRLSPSAEECLTHLRSNAQATRRRGQEAARNLSQAEAAVVFKVLAGDVRRSESLASSNSPPLASVLELVEARRTLRTDLVALLRDIPGTRLPGGIGPSVHGLFQDEPTEEYFALLRAWRKLEGHAEVLSDFASETLASAEEE